jgi:hypothetical protein
MESVANKFERTHMRRKDLDWMPGHWRAIQWGVAGTIWTAEVAAFLFASHSVGDLGGVFWAAGFFTAGWYAGGRAARMALRRKAQRMAGGKLDLTKLKNEEDGELVHVRGKVRARDQIEGWLGGRGVYQRLLFTVGQVPLVHERLVDFTLVDESGETVWVQVDGARLIGPEPRVRDVGD